MKRYQAWVHGTVDMGVVEAVDEADAAAQVLAQLVRHDMAQDCRSCGAYRSGPVGACIQVEEIWGDLDGGAVRS